MPDTPTGEAAKVDHNSNTDDILAEAAKQREAEKTQEAKPASEEKPPGSASEGEKTPGEEEKDEFADIKEGSPIAYPRFKTVVDQRNREKQEKEDALTQLETLQSQIDEQAQLLQDPDVVKFIQQKQSKTEQQEKPEQEYDLTTQKGWQDWMEDKLNQKLAPILQTVQTHAQTLTQKEVGDRLDKQKGEAVDVCKNLGIKYGDEVKDVKDLTTGVGLLSAHLTKHPDRARLIAEGKLSKADVIRIELSERGYKMGEQKGKADEQKRQKELEAASMESGEKVQKEDFPNKNWTNEDILAYKAKHPDAVAQF